MLLASYPGHLQGGKVGLTSTVCTVSEFYFLGIFFPTNMGNSMDYMYVQTRMW